MNQKSGPQLLPRSLWSEKSLHTGARRVLANQEPAFHSIRERFQKVRLKAEQTNYPHPILEPSFTLEHELFEAFRKIDTSKYWEETLADRNGEQNPMPLPAYIYQERDWPKFIGTVNIIRDQITTALECTLVGVADEDSALLDKGLRIWRDMVAWTEGGFCDDWHGDMVSILLSLRLVRIALWQESRLTPEDWKNLEKMLVWRMRGTWELLKFYKIDQYPLDSHVSHGACNFACTVFAVEDRFPSLKVYADWAREKLEPLFPVWGKNDGGWSPGVNYWKWSVRCWLFWADLYPLNHPLRQLPWIQNTGWFKLYAHPPYSRQGAFGDHSDTPPDKLDGSIMRYLGALTGRGEFTWYAEALALNQHGIRDPGPLFDEVEALAFDFVSLSVPTKAIPPLGTSTSCHFEDTGIIASHTHLGNAEKDLMLLFRSSRWGSFNHAHADQNSFIIESGGEPILIDAGYYPTFHHPHMKKFTIQTAAHNAILIDGVGQTTRNLHSRGKITHFETSSASDVFTGDATEAYAGRGKKVLRHMWFQKEAPIPFVVLMDVIETTHPHTMDWLLHSYEEMEIDPEKKTILATGWRKFGGKSRALTHILTPEELYWHQTDQFPAPADERESDKAKQWHLTVTPKGYFSKSLFIATIQIGNASSPWITPHYSSQEKTITVGDLQLQCDPQRGFWK
ncbi:MAG: heparinase II/III family protein [Verrucomicrobiota bacterium]